MLGGTCPPVSPIIAAPATQDTYLGLDFGAGDGEVDGGGEARYGQAARRDAPAHTVAVARVVLQLLAADQVDTVQPVVLVLPRL